MNARQADRSGLQRSKNEDNKNVIETDLMMKSRKTFAINWIEFDGWHLIPTEILSQLEYIVLL